MRRGSCCWPAANGIGPTCWKAASLANADARAASARARQRAGSNRKRSRPRAGRRLARAATRARLALARTAARAPPRSKRKTPRAAHLDSTLRRLAMPIAANVSAAARIERPAHRRRRIIEDEIVREEVAERDTVGERAECAPRSLDSLGAEIDGDDVVPDFCERALLRTRSRDPGSARARCDSHSRGSRGPPEEPHLDPTALPNRGIGSPRRRLAPGPAGQRAQELSAKVLGERRSRVGDPGGVSKSCSGAKAREPHRHAARAERLGELREATRDRSAARCKARRSSRRTENPVPVALDDGSPQPGQ